MPNITNRDCETRVTKQVKIYDAKCPGFYVSVSRAGAVFNLRYFDRAQKKQVAVRIGTYNKDNFNVEDAAPRPSISAHAPTAAKTSPPRASMFRSSGSKSAAT